MIKNILFQLGKQLNITRLRYLILLSLLASEILTAIGMVITSYLFRKAFVLDFLIAGLITVSIVAPVVLSLSFFLIRQLRISEEQFRIFAEFTYDWETWQKPDGTYQYITPSCKRITGYGPEEFMENPELIVQITHPDHQKAVKKHFNDCLQKELPFCSIDFRIITKNGDEIWIDHHCESVFASDGTWMGRRASNRDISKRKRAAAEREKVIADLQQALAEVKTLRGLIPICAHCKNIRNDDGYWQQLEHYFQEHTDVQFSHGICPDCVKKLYPDIYQTLIKNGDSLL